MSTDSTKLIIPGKGTIFHSAANLALPEDPLESFNLTGPPPTGFTNLGHTSTSNSVSFSREGGEATSLSTWLEAAVRTIYSDVAWSLAIPALQFDEDVLDLAFNGDFDPVTGGYIVPGNSAPTEAGLFLLMQDNSGKLGFWIPNTSVTLGEPPSVDKESFMELPLTAAISGGSPAVMPAVNGQPGIMQIFKTGLVAN